MRKPSRGPILALALVSTTLLLSCTDGSEDAAVSESSDGARSLVTPAEGPSWLHRLDLEVSETRMGQMGGTTPQPGARGEEPELVGSVEGQGRGMHSALRRALSAFGRGDDPDALADRRFRLTGTDLYRLSCRSCHGPDGTGSPPEIKSLLDPVRAASPAAIQARMEARGAAIDDGMAAELASQAEAEIRKRLQEGGEKMPSFEHLRGDEVEALLGYLRELAGLNAGDRGEMLVPQSAARVGEHLVKGTCHTCHDATGPGGHHEVMMSGIVPSLESFPEAYSLDSVLYKVERGSSGMMGMMGMMRRNQEMPAFPYFSQEEVASGYVYLRAYPPEP